MIEKKERKKERFILNWIQCKVFFY